MPVGVVAENELIIMAEDIFECKIGSGSIDAESAGYGTDDDLIDTVVA